MYSFAYQVALMVKNLPASVGDIRDTGLIPSLGRYPGGGHGNTLHYSCLENPTDREAWQATVHRVTKSQTRLRQFCTHAHIHICTLFRLFSHIGHYRILRRSPSSETQVRWPSSFLTTNQKIYKNTV